MTITFCRVGGLSPKKYKDQTTKVRDRFFHFPPPEKYGLYAFIYPYVDPFLFAGIDNKMKTNKTRKPHGNRTWNGKGISSLWEDHPLKWKLRKFKHHGLIWCHHVDEAYKLGVSLQIKRSWVKIHTVDLDRILRKVKHRDLKACWNDMMLAFPVNELRPDHPYHRGRGGYISKDHLEVFIPGKIHES